MKSDMTTLTYRAGILASDSRMTNNGTIIGSAIKIRKRGPLLFAGCGSWALVTRFIDWSFKGCAGNPPPMIFPDADTTASGFIFMPNGTILTFEPSGPSVQHCEYFAEGSGRDTALGALAMGATAVEAIRVAIQHDIYSGGDIQVLTHD